VDLKVLKSGDDVSSSAFTTGSTRRESLDGGGEGGGELITADHIEVCCSTSSSNMGLCVVVLDGTKAANIVSFGEITDEGMYMRSLQKSYMPKPTNDYAQINRKSWLAPSMHNTHHAKKIAQKRGG